MAGRVFISVFAAAAILYADAAPILGVANAPSPFSIDSVQTKPEAGPVSVVEGDEVTTVSTPVAFHLNGENGATLGANSSAKIRGYQDSGSYFYLSKGAIQFDARKQPLAICAKGRLYVPSIPASGEIAIRDKAAQVKMVSGSMVRSGTEACDAKAVPVLLSGPGSAAGSAGAAVTATASAAGVGGATAATITGVTLAAATVAGVTATVVAAQGPASESPITPGQ